MAVKRRADVRDAVVNSLMRTQNGSKFSNLELDSALEKYDFSPKDRALFTALYYGVIERQITLDKIISTLSTREFSKIDERALQILRMALYQLIYMDRIPEHAAVSSAVELTHKGGTDSFVNALLRSYLRSKDKFLPENTGLSGVELLSYKYSVPAWMIEEWSEDYGIDMAEKIADAANSHPYMTLRVNTIFTDRDSVIKELAVNEVEAVSDESCESAVHLKSNYPIDKITVIKNGRAFVQDLASQLCCEALCPNENDFVLDVCSCPGGKSFSLAMLMKNNGRIISSDLHKSKLSLVADGAKKLGIDIIETCVRDGREAVEELISSADKILCDVPCSGLGVLAKKPDIRHKNKEDVHKLPEIQYAILKNSAEYLKVGGTLVYSTCTVRRAENENVIEKFVLGDDRFVFEPFSVGEYQAPDGRLTIFPSEKTDGFFVSKIKRIK